MEMVGNDKSKYCRHFLAARLVPCWSQVNPRGLRDVVSSQSQCRRHFAHVVSVGGVPWERSAERQTLSQTEEVQSCAPPTSRGRPDAWAGKLSISCAMHGCALAGQAYFFARGGSAFYLH